VVASAAAVQPQWVARPVQSGGNCRPDGSGADDGNAGLHSGQGTAGDSVRGYSRRYGCALTDRFMLLSRSG
jgi:hypothetical protein